MKFSSKDIELFGEAGIYVEDRNYSREEVERLKIKVTDFIMSQSTKENNKYSKKSRKDKQIYLRSICRTSWQMYI